VLAGLHSAGGGRNYLHPHPFLQLVMTTFTCGKTLLGEAECLVGGSALIDEELPGEELSSDEVLHPELLYTDPDQPQNIICVSASDCGKSVQGLNLGACPEWEYPQRPSKCVTKSMS
jgi:hypothetical protein